MQLINKDAIKKTFAHTWYIYPISVILMTLVWMWGFQAYHQPTKLEKLTMFIAANVKRTSFANKIMNDNYPREKLREVNVFYSLPNAVGYRSKVNIYLNDSDFLILDETTISELAERSATFFAKMDDYVKTYIPSSTVTYFSRETIDYGIKIKNKNEESWLSTYMTFDENQDYYLFLSITSKNLGKLYNEKNEKNDNALTYMNHLLTECL